MNFKGPEKAVDRNKEENLKNCAINLKILRAHINFIYFFKIIENILIPIEATYRRNNAGMDSNAEKD